MREIKPIFMKVAIVHEMLVKLWWAEKVVEVFAQMFPDAPIFTLMYDEKATGDIFPKTSIHPQVFRCTTQKIYNICNRQRWCLPWMSRSIESFDFWEYDLVLVSSSWFAHGIITLPETKVVVYSHSPARYLWDWTYEYQRDIWARRWVKWYLFAKLAMSLRQWDFMASQRADLVLANSANTYSRIQKYYKRTAPIVYPPVDIHRFFPLPWKTQYDTHTYIIISALTPFKKIDVAIETFCQMPDKKLKIIWSGDHMNVLQKMAADNIEFSGRLYGDDLVNAIRESAGLIFPGEEDFGIAPIEVMAAGKPVFALWKGGLLESVIPGKTGEFFMDPDGWDFLECFQTFHENNISWTYLPQTCIDQAKRFDKQIFIDTLKKYIS